MADIAQLKQWCDDARKILSLTGKDSRGKMKDRNADVAKLLEKLKGIPTLATDYAMLLKEYEAITNRASFAASEGDKAGVANASRDLSVLKNTLRIKLAEAPNASKAEVKSGAKAEKKMESGEKQKWSDESVKRKKQTVLDEINRLVDPNFAGTEALRGLQTERDTATRALSDEVPTAEQFQTAERAIIAFGQKVELEKTRVSDKRQTLLGDVPKLVDPPFANGEALAALKLERDAASNALSGELPTPAQLQTAERAIAAFGQKVELEKTRVSSKRQTLLGEVTLLVDPAFANGEALAALKLERDAATNALSAPLPTPAQLQAAERAIAAFGQKVELEKIRVSKQRQTLLDTLGTLTDPVGADVDEKKAMKVERDKAGLALTDKTPTPDKIKEAEKAIAALEKLVKHSAKLSALATKNPKAATAARSAFKDFKKVIGDVEVTPELINEATQARVDRARELGEKTTAWQQAKKLPDGTEEQRLLKQQEIEKTLNAAREADRKNKEAIARENALLGQKLLTDAVSHGPLSGETGQPFEDSTAEKFVKAYKKDPRLADAAVKSATTSKYPDAIAGGLDQMISMVGNNFKPKAGGGFKSADYARKYGENLLRMGGEIGDDFFNRLPAYIESGHHFDSKPLGDTGATSFPQLAQKRSVTLAKKLMKPDGTIDLTSDDAKGAIGNMLFHPDGMRNQTPAMNAHILKTLKFLEDPVTGPEASNVLKGTTKPTDPGAQKLVRTALGKGDTESVDDGETRTAVLASMLKPLDQGPVGSCFSTAPTRRMRETRPLDAMKAFSDIASKGTYKPANGVEVPVVTNTPDDEDPIQRSWEYTLATSTARTGDSQQKGTFTNNMALGTDQLKTIAGGKAKEWNLKKAKLKNDVKDAFTFVYDPLSKVTDSNDGSSSQGRYVTKRVSNGKEIRTRDDFVAEMADVAITSLGIDPNSEKAKEVRELVKQDSFVNAVCPGKYKPWELSSGGQTEAATRTLFGSGIDHIELLEGSPKTGKLPEGERTQQVLTSFLDAFAGRSDEMVTMTTITMHGFNGLPNHPSLAGLKGATPTETAQKVQTNLVDKGQALKNTDLSAERAAWLFDQEMQKAIDAEKDPLLKVELEKGATAKRPGAPMKPAALTTAIKEAKEDYHDLVADKRAKEWELKEPVQPVAPQKLTEKKTKLKEALTSSAENGAKSLLIRDLGAPEFVIADTNWGDSTSHTFFVIAPDPTTGEPIMWKKEEPPGSLTPAGRQWVDDQWTRVE